MALAIPVGTLLARTREAIGSAAWMAMYQQRPAAEEGAVFNRQWWRHYQTATRVSRIMFSLIRPSRPRSLQITQSSRSRGQTTTGYCLLHVWRQRAEFPQIEEAGDRVGRGSGGRRRC